MLPDKKIACHRTFGAPKVRSCYEMVTKHNCQMYGHIRGTNKSTDEVVNKYGCLYTFEHLMDIEAVDALRKMDAEVSALRTEVRELTAKIAEANANAVTMHRQSTQLALIHMQHMHEQDGEPQQLIEAN